MKIYSPENKTTRINHKINKFHIFGIIVFVTQLHNNVRYDFAIADWVLFISASICGFLYFETIKGGIKDNISVLFLLFYIYLSAIACSAFRLLGDEFSFIEYQSLADFSNKLYFIFFLVAFIFSIFNKNVVLYENIVFSGQKPFKKSFAQFFFIFLFFLSILSGILGIGRMGAEGILLPFKLSGIIRVLKDVAPYILMLIFVKNVKNSKQFFFFFFLIVLWGLLEAFFTLSKSSLIYTVLPIIIYCFLSPGNISKSITKFFIPVLIVFVFLYPIIGNMRDMMRSNSDSRLEAFHLSLRETENENNGRSAAIYSRTFSTGSHYMRILSFLRKDDFWNFSNTVPIFLIGGSAQYMTVIVDGFPPEAIHSSGTTGLTDALLIGGYGLCYLTLVLLIALAFFLDGKRMKKNLCLRVFLFVFFTEIVRTKTYTYFIDGVAFPTLVTKLFLLFFILKTYIQGRVYLQKTKGLILKSNN